jgi:hypothetical protein
MVTEAGYTFVPDPTTVFGDRLRHRAIRLRGRQLRPDNLSAKRCVPLRKGLDPKRSQKVTGGRHRRDRGGATSSHPRRRIVGDRLGLDLTGAQVVQPPPRRQRDAVSAVVVPVPRGRRLRLAAGDCGPGRATPGSSKWCTRAAVTVPGGSAPHPRRRGRRRVGHRPVDGGTWPQAVCATGRSWSCPVRVWGRRHPGGGCTPRHGDGRTARGRPGRVHLSRGRGPPPARPASTAALHRRYRPAPWAPTRIARPLARFGRAAVDVHHLTRCLGAAAARPASLGGRSTTSPAS